MENLQQLISVGQLVPELVLVQQLPPEKKQTMKRQTWSLTLD